METKLENCGGVGFEPTGRVNDRRFEDPLVSHALCHDLCHFP